MNVFLVYTSIKRNPGLVSHTWFQLRYTPRCLIIPDHISYGIFLFLIGIYGSAFNTGCIFTGNHPAFRADPAVMQDDANRKKRMGSSVTVKRIDLSSRAGSSVSPTDWFRIVSKIFFHSCMHFTWNSSNISMHAEERCIDCTGIIAFFGRWSGGGEMPVDIQVFYSELRQ